MRAPNLNGQHTTPEDSHHTNKPKIKTAKSAYLWTVADVQKWFRRHCSDYYALYIDNFIRHEITGRTLMRLRDNSLIRLGIEDMGHRDAIWREILQLKLRTDIMEIRDLDRRNTNNMLNDYSIV